MPDGPRPEKIDQLEDALALRFRGRRRIRHADELLAAIVAERLAEHLAESGFVIMKRLPSVGASALDVGQANRRLIDTASRPHHSDKISGRQWPRESMGLGLQWRPTDRFKITFGRHPASRRRHAGSLMSCRTMG